MRGRKPTPSNLKRLMGNPGKRPYNEEEPQPALAASLEPPAGLGSDARDVWSEIAPALAACRLFTSLDIWKLELLAVHLGLHRSLYRRLLEVTGKQIGGETGDTPLRVQAIQLQGQQVDASRLLRSIRQEAEIVKSLCAGFGLDPSDRSRLKVTSAPADDAFSQFEEHQLSRPTFAGNRLGGRS